MLMEDPTKGRTEGFAEVITDVEMPIGKILNLKILGNNGHQLFGSPV